MSRPSLIVCLLSPVLLVAGCDRGSPEPVQANVAAVNDTAAASAEPGVSPDEAAPVAPADGGAALKPDYSHAGEAAPGIAFKDAAGKPVTLAAFKGKPVLLNLWATWCAPCVAELPTLDALAKREAGKLAVVTVSQDLDPARAAAFWAKRGLSSLVLHTDAEVKFSTAFQATLPTTVLYDAAGKEVWRFTGGMNWAGPAAAAMIAGRR